MAEKLASLLASTERRWQRRFFHLFGCFVVLLLCCLVVLLFCRCDEPHWVMQLHVWHLRRSQTSSTATCVQANSAYLFVFFFFFPFSDFLCLPLFVCLFVCWLAGRLFCVLANRLSFEPVPLALPFMCAFFFIFFFHLIFNGGVWLHRQWVEEEAGAGAKQTAARQCHFCCCFSGLIVNWEWWRGRKGGVAAGLLLPNGKHLIAYDSHRKSVGLD